MSRRTTPGSIGRNTLSHSDNCSSAFASFTGPTMESDTAADWYKSSRRLKDKEEEEEDGEAEALGMRR